MNVKDQHSFWGSLSPLGGLSGAALLIISSARLSWAITTSFGLIWVYGLTTISYVFLSTTASKIFPQEGKKPLFTCLAAFFGSFYLLMFWLLCPFAAFEAFFPILLIPLFCARSGIIDNIASPSDAHSDVFDHVSHAVSYAITLAVLIIAFSIIREPLSYCSLTFPGSASGMLTIMYFKSGSFFPIGIFAASSGALLLLGFFVCLYQYCKSIFSRGEL